MKLVKGMDGLVCGVATERVGDGYLGPRAAQRLSEVG
jgi:hypothetical protein